MSSSAPLSRQTSNDAATPPPIITFKLLTLRTHTSAFSPNEVLINPALVPFAKPGSLLQIIPQNDLENESAAATDRYIFHLGDESEKDVSTKYGNLQLSVVTEVAKAFKFTTGSQVAVSLVHWSPPHRLTVGRRNGSRSRLCRNGIQRHVPGSRRYVATRTVITRQNHLRW